MNHTIRFALVLFLGGVAALGAQDNNRWTMFQSLDWPERLAYLDKQPKVQTDGTFLLQALELTDSAQVESGSDNETAVKKELTLRLVKLLAENSVPGAIAAIGRLPGQYKDPFLKGESWLALAKLGDKTFVPGLVGTLAALNESGTRTHDEEIQASYAIQALGVLKASEGFRAVAAASLSWYSPTTQIRPLARKTMLLLVPDLEKALLPLLADDADLSLRDGLFQQVVDQGDQAATARAASAVLGTLVYLRSENKADQDRAERLTLSSLMAAQAAPAPPASLIPPLKILLGRTDDYEVQVQSIRLLGKIDDPAAVSLLSDTLSGFNSRQKGGANTSRDLSLVRELFQALARTGKPAARTVLDEARFSDYTPGLVREAQAAENQLPRE